MAFAFAFAGGAVLVVVEFDFVTLPLAVFVVVVVVFVVVVVVFTGAGVAVFAGATFAGLLVALLAGAASPQAIPIAPSAKTVESTITFFIILLSSSKLKLFAIYFRPHFPRPCSISKFFGTNVNIDSQFAIVNPKNIRKNYFSAFFKEILQIWAYFAQKQDFGSGLIFCVSIIY